MANLQHVGGKQRHRRQRQTRSPSPSDPHDWERIQHPTVDSLPYRTRSRTAHVDGNIQMPESASRRMKHSVSSSHRSYRASEDLHESMPPPTALNRSRTVPHTRGKGLLNYEDEDDNDDEDLPSPSRERRSRPRIRRRARSRSRSLSGSDRSSSRSETVITPSRSARVNRSTPNSRRSSRSASSRRSSSADSASTVSTQGEVKEILRRRPADIQVTSDDEGPGHRRHRRRHRDRGSAILEEEPTRRVRHVVPIRIESRAAPSRPARHQSQSRSSSRRRSHRQHDRREVVSKPSGSKRCVGQATLHLLSVHDINYGAEATRSTMSQTMSIWTGQSCQGLLLRMSRLLIV